MSAAEHLDEAVNALAEASVALTSLYPVLTILRAPPEPVEFIEDGLEALSRARREVTAARAYFDTGQHSVKAPESDPEPEYGLLNERMARLTEAVAGLMLRVEAVAPVRDSEGAGGSDAP